MELTTVFSGKESVLQDCLAEFACQVEESSVRAERRKAGPSEFCEAYLI